MAAARSGVSFPWPSIDLRIVSFRSASSRSRWTRSWISPIDHFVQVAGRFLAVARDEGNGVPIVQELNDALDLRAPNLQVLRDATQVHLNRVAHVDSTRHLVRQERRRRVRPIRGIARNSYLNGKSLALQKVSARRHLPTKRVWSL